MSTPKTVTVLSTTGKQLPSITRKRASQWLSQGRAVLVEGSDTTMTILLQERVVVEVPSQWEQKVRQLASVISKDQIVALSDKRIFVLAAPDYIPEEWSDDHPSISVPHTLDGIQSALDWLTGAYEESVHADAEEDDDGYV